MFMELFSFYPSNYHGISGITKRIFISFFSFSSFFKFYFNFVVVVARLCVCVQNFFLKNTCIAHCKTLKSKKISHVFFFFHYIYYRCFFNFYVALHTGGNRLHIQRMKRKKLLNDKFRKKIHVLFSFFCCSLFNIRFTSNQNIFVDVHVTCICGKTCVIKYFKWDKLNFFSLYLCYLRTFIYSLAF